MSAASTEATTTGTSRTPDFVLLRLLVIGLLVSCSISRSPLTIGRSIEHSSLIYADALFGALLAAFGILDYLLFGRVRGTGSAAWLIIPLGALTAWCAVSGWLNLQHVDFYIASIQKYANALLIVMFSATAIVRYRLTGFVMDAFLICALGVGLIGIGQGLLNPSKIFNGITSVLNPNHSHIGLYMLSAMAVGLYRMADVGGKWRTAAVLLAFACIIISGSRASLIGALPVLAVHFFRQLTFGGMAKAAAGILLIFVITHNVGDTRREIETEHSETTASESGFEISEGITIDKSAGRRLFMWAATWESITSSPKAFWTGFGFSRFRWEFGQAIDLFFYTNAAHNVFLHLWAETGIIGLLLYLAVFASMITFSLRWRKAHPPILLLAGLSIGMLLTGTTQETFYPNEAESNFPVLLAFVFLAFLLDTGLKTAKAKKGA